MQLTAAWTLQDASHADGGLSSWPALRYILSRKIQLFCMNIVLPLVDSTILRYCTHCTRHSNISEKDKIKIWRCIIRSHARGNKTQPSSHGPVSVFFFSSLSRVAMSLPSSEASGSGSRCVLCLYMCYKYLKLCLLSVCRVYASSNGPLTPPEPTRQELTRKRAISSVSDHEPDFELEEVKRPRLADATSFAGLGDESFIPSASVSSFSLLVSAVYPSHAMPCANSNLANSNKEESV